MTQVIGRDPAGQTGMIKAYDHAQKLYQVSDRFIGVMGYGAGNIGPRSIGSFLTEFGRIVTEDEKLKTVEAIAQKLSTFLGEEHAKVFGQLAADQQPILGILLGGYSPKKPLAEEWEFSIPNDPTPKLVRPVDQFGASWRGVNLPFARVYRGLDPRLHADLLQAGLTQQKIGELQAKYTSPFIFDGMPIQEAIEFVTFILETTINTAKFEAGFASCGGPLWIAVATPDAFEWVKKHEWRSKVR